MAHPSLARAREVLARSEERQRATAPESRDRRERLLLELDDAPDRYVVHRHALRGNLVFKVRDNAQVDDQYVTRQMLDALCEELEVAISDALADVLFEIDQLRQDIARLKKSDDNAGS